MIVVVPVLDAVERCIAQAELDRVAHDDPLAIDVNRERESIADAIMGMRGVDSRMIHRGQPMVRRQSDVHVLVQAQGDQFDCAVDSMVDGIYTSRSAWDRAEVRDLLACSRMILFWARRSSKPWL